MPIPAAKKTSDKFICRTSNLIRSEEHTSELQSPDQLVCRVLLEKKTDQRSGHPVCMAGWSKRGGRRRCAAGLQWTAERVRAFAVRGQTVLPVPRSHPRLLRSAQG